MAVSREATSDRWHLSVLLRESQVGERTLEELTDVVREAWLSRASPSGATAWLRAHTTG
jgi:hypothetical protein